MKDLRSLRKHYQKAHQHCPREKIVNSKRKREYPGAEEGSEEGLSATKEVAIAMVTTKNDLDEAPSHSVATLPVPNFPDLVHQLVGVQPEKDEEQPMENHDDKEPMENHDGFSMFEEDHVPE
jgi:hypothetical protein